jgi:starch phosphorylase
VSTVIHLGTLSPEDVRVELYGGRLNENRKIVDGAPTPMELDSALGDGSFRYTGTYTCASAGSQGFGVRVYPWHQELSGPFEMGLMSWA